MVATKSRYLPLLLAILLAALLQTILLVRAPTISADGIIFTSIARDLARDPVAAMRQHDQHPGFPAAMLASTRLVQALGYRAEPESWIVGGRAVCFVCGLLSVWVVWRFARDLYDERVANIAAMVFAMLPLVRANAADAQSDVPHLLCYLTAAWLAVVAVKTDRLLPLAGAAAASAIAYWIRPEGLEVLLVLVVFVAWQGLRHQWPWRRVGLAATALAGVTLLLVAPYPLVAGKITSKQLPFFKQQVRPTFIAQLAEAAAEEPNSSAPPQVTPPGAAVQAEPSPVAAAEIAAPDARLDPPAPTPPPTPQPLRRYSVSLIARLAAGGLAGLIECLCYGLRFVFIPFYFVGQWEMVRRRTPKRVIAFLWALALLHMAILLWVYFVSGYIASRHVLPLVGLAMPFVALGVLYVEEKVMSVWPLPAPRIAVATLAVSSLVVLPYAVRAYNREFVPVIEATRWIQSRAAPGSGIVCNSPYVGYYGTLPTTILGPGALSVEAALAQGNPGVRYDYVVLHVGAHGYRPEWMAQIEQRYRPVREYDDPTAVRRPRKVVVFEAVEAQARRKLDDPRS